MAAYNFNGVSALVIEDNRFMREILISMLKALGVHRLRQATDGADAMTLLKTTPFDFILCDIEMPMIDGIDFTHAVRTWPDIPDPFIPIIIVSGHTSRKKVETARDAGMTEFLVKPITAQSLCERMLEIIDRPRPFIKAPAFMGPDRRRHQLSRPNTPKRRAEDRGDKSALVVIED